LEHTITFEFPYSASKTLICWLVMMAVMETVLWYCTLHRTILEGLNQGKLDV